MILIVDDEENIRKVLKGLLGQNGYKDIMEAADGIAAFNLLQEYEADLIICDYKMPGMNGMELFRKLDKRNFLFILLCFHLLLLQNMKVPKMSSPITFSLIYLRILSLII